jgi:hypothetical protein
MATSNRIQSAALQLIAAGKGIEGFELAVNAVAEEIPFIDREGRPTPFIEAVLEAEKPAELLHWLGSHVDALAAFVGLTPVQTGRRMLLLEQSIA